MTRSSVDALREERARLIASINKAGEAQSGPMTLTPKQRHEWVDRRVAVINAQIAEDEYLNSLLGFTLDDEKRDKIVEDLYQEVADVSGRDAADLVDFAHESDYSLVRDHERYLEDVAEMNEASS